MALIDDLKNSIVGGEGSAAELLNQCNNVDDVHTAFLALENFNPFLNKNNTNLKIARANFLVNNPKHKPNFSYFLVPILCNIVIANHFGKKADDVHSYAYGFAVGVVAYIINLTYTYVLIGEWCKKRNQDPDYSAAYNGARDRYNAVLPLVKRRQDALLQQLPRTIDAEQVEPIKTKIKNVDQPLDDWELIKQVYACNSEANKIVEASIVKRSKRDAKEDRADLNRRNSITKATLGVLWTVALCYDLVPLALDNETSHLKLAIHVGFFLVVLQTTLYACNWYEHYRVSALAKTRLSIYQRIAAAVCLNAVRDGAQSHYIDFDVVGPVAYHPTH